MTLVDGLLLLGALLCVAQFAVAVSYRFRRNNPTYDPKKEVGAYIIAGSMTTIFTIASWKIFNKPEFEAFGVAMLVVMVIYYVFMSLEMNGKPKEDI